MATIQKVVQAQKNATSIKGLIKERFSRSEVRAPLRPGDKVRASGLYKICPREEVLAARHQVMRTDDISADLHLIFGHGYAIHHYLQNELLPDLGVLLGSWRCTHCAKAHGRFKKGVPLEWCLRPRPRKCRRCSNRSFEYEEASLADDKLLITGHPDGFLVIPSYPGIGLLEAKTVSGRGAADVRFVPNVSHVLQAQVYMHMTGCKWTKILYWQKDVVGLSGLIEHDIEYDSETIQNIQTTMLKIQSGLLYDELPDRICGTPTCDRAKSCQLKDQCFVV